MPIPIQNQENHHHHENHNTPINQNHLPKPNSNTQSKNILSLFLKCIIMVFVLSIFLLFLGFAAVVVLHFLVTTTAFRRRSHRRQRFPAKTPDLRELPCVNYSAVERSVNDCAICLEGFKEGDVCRNLPDCGHLFHVKCVDSWLTRVLNCPVCRTRVRIDPASSGSGSSNEDWKTMWTVGV